MVDPSLFVRSEQRAIRIATARSAAKYARIWTPPERGEEVAKVQK